MKNLKYSILTFCFVLFLTEQYAYGQTYTSSTTHTFYSITDCDTAITRVWGQSLLVTCTNIPDMTSNNFCHFILRNDYAIPAKILNLNRRHNIFGLTRERITDVKIFDDTCYFCGVCVYPTDFSITPEGEIIQPDSASVGFVGYFSIKDVLDNTGHYFIKDIPEVSSLSKLAVYGSIDSGNVCITAIGKPKTNPTITCITSIARSTAAPYFWKYYVAKTNIDDERMTDIITTDDFWVTASVFDQNDKYIGFRDTKVTNFGFYRETFWSDYPDLFQYNIIDSLSIYRYANSPVFMSRMKNNGFSAGFAGDTLIENALSRSGHVYVMNMHNPSFMGELQSITSQHNVKIKDLAYLENVQSTAVLFRSTVSLIDPSFQNYLQCVKWGSQETYCDTILSLSNGKLLSLDSYQGSLIALGGLKELQYPTDAIQRYANRSNSCLKIHDCRNIKIRKTVQCKYEQSSFEPISNVVWFHWYAFESETGTEHSIYCAH